jgi:hypothetical protein
MSVHDYHEGLPGYHPDQLLHDGCAECEARGKDVATAIGHLDRTNFIRAWARAADWNKGRLNDSAVSKAEAPLLRVLWALEIKFEPRGIAVGSCPTGF